MRPPEHRFRQKTEAGRGNERPLQVNSVNRVLRLIGLQVREFQTPSVTEVSRQNDPYLVLVSCILSLRTKDATTLEAGKRLFGVAETPQEMVQLSRERIQKLIYPVGFYRVKAGVVLGVSRAIIDNFAGRVPRTRRELLSLKGVGRKTANLVLGLAYGIPAICVDTHVHRISNRLGWVVTKAPEETESRLERIIPRSRWIELNTVFVAFGQTICQPVSPLCSRCSVRRWCRRKGVTKSR